MTSPVFEATFGLIVLALLAFFAWRAMWEANRQPTEQHWFDAYDDKLARDRKRALDMTEHRLVNLNIAVERARRNKKAHVALKAQRDALQAEYNRMRPS